MTFRSLWFALVLVATSLLSSPAAARQTVVLVLAGGSAAELFPYELRVRSELLASGFAVTAVQVPDADNTGQLARTAGGMMTKAAVAIVLSEDSVSGAVWATSHDSQRTLLRTIQPVPVGEEAATVFAIRATEVLNAVLIELGYPPRTPPEADTPPAASEPPPDTSLPPPPTGVKPPESPEQTPVPASSSAPRRSASPPPGPRVSTPPAAAATEAGSVWRVRAGAALLAGPGGVPPAVAPGLALQLAPEPSWWLELAFVAPGLSRLRDQTGSAEIDQELVVLGLGASAPLASWAHGFVSLGGGAHRLGVRGSGAPHYSGNRDHVLSAAGLLDVGTRLRLGEGWWLQLDAAAMLTTPRAEIVFADRVQARSGLPLLLAGISLCLDL